MPPRRRPAAAESLSPDDLTALAAAVAEGRRATVYLREGTPSLNLAPGSSARVISVSGSTVLIRPRGVNDELPYEADELRMTKTPPAQPEPKPKPKSKPTETPAPQPPAPRTPAPRPPAPTPPTAPAAPAETPSAPATPKPARRPPAKKSGASVTVTIHGSADNEWSVAIARGARKPNRSRPVAAEAVEAAVRELGDAPTVDAVTTLLHAAREEAQRRVEELSAQLEAARKALAALE